MERLRTVMFIDGRNFKYNLDAFRFVSKRKQGKADESGGDQDRYYALNEKHFNWQPFFEGIMNKYDKATGWEHRLVRVYWYNAAKIRPFSVNEALIQSIIDKYQGRFPELDYNKVIELAKSWYDNERHYFDNTKEEVYEKIQRKTAFLEFIYTGEYVVKPFDVYHFEKNADGTYFYQGIRKGEKGVDVGIAVDMIAKMPNYDVAILVSGDADFLPLLCHVKDNLKSVYQFSIAQGIPPNIKYLSP